MLFQLLILRHPVDSAITLCLGLVAVIVGLAVFMEGLSTGLMPFGNIIGDNLAELALQFGADDIDGTVQKESIMHLAGSSAPLDHDRTKLARLIHDAGCEPIQRNTVYTQFEPYTPPKIKRRRTLPMATQ